MATKLRREAIHTHRGEASRLVIRCDCGTELLCLKNTNVCSGCGTDYNMSGQELAPREQWGEETGEHYLDVVNGMDAEDAL